MAPSKAIRAQDVCQIALVERHRATGGVVNGFVSGFGYRGRMAMASTVAHDSHHMIVVGTSRADMALAANRLAAGRRRHHRLEGRRRDRAGRTADRRV